MEKIISKSLA
jgi:molybdenum-dependent DNA-binding transcriptional regulator ModE